MERCRSSEAGLGSQKVTTTPVGDGRDGRRRDVKATSLLFKTVPSKEQIQDLENGETYHLGAPVPIARVESRSLPELDPVEDDRMDIDLDDQPDLLSEEAVAEKMAAMQEEAPQVWGMPKWGWEEDRNEVRKGVRLLGMEEVSLQVLSVADDIATRPG
jgi:dual specificity MAP kinase phosphatase